MGEGEWESGRPGKDRPLVLPFGPLLLFVSVPKSSSFAVATVVVGLVCNGPTAVKVIRQSEEGREGQGIERRASQSQSQSLTKPNTEKGCSHPAMRKIDISASRYPSMNTVHDNHHQTI